MTRAIYALKHLRTNKVYIGATANLVLRRKKWRSKIFSGFLPPRMRDLFGDFQSVEFVVLQEFSDEVPMSTVHQTEAKWIAATHRIIGERLLNEMHAPTRRVGLVAKSTYYLRVSKGMDPSIAAQLSPSKPVHHTMIVDRNGEVMTYPDAARELGCLTQTLWKRLANKRERFPHINTYSIDDLKKATEKAKSYWKRKPTR